MKRMVIILLVVVAISLGFYSYDRLAKTKRALLFCETKISSFHEEILQLSQEKSILLAMFNKINVDLKRATQNFSLLEDTIRQKDKRLVDLRESELASKTGLEAQKKTRETLRAELTALKERARTLEEALHERGEAINAQLASKEQALFQLKEKSMFLEWDLRKARESVEALKMASKRQAVSPQGDRVHSLEGRPRVVSGQALAIDHKLLEGLGGVEVVIEGFPQVAEQGGLSIDQLKSEVESVLRMENIRILTSEDRTSVQGTPYLSVHVDALKLGKEYAYHIELQLKEIAFLERDSSKISSGAAIWRAAFLGKGYSPQDIFRSTADLAGIFVSDYATANPKMTVRLPAFKEKTGD
jgi:hypothetical protein